jgi:hypothetical protein
MQNLPFKYLFLYLVLLACNALAWYFIKLLSEYIKQNRFKENFYHKYYQTHFKNH